MCTMRAHAPGCVCAVPFVLPCPCTVVCDAPATPLGRYAVWRPRAAYGAVLPRATHAQAARERTQPSMIHHRLPSPAQQQPRHNSTGGQRECDDSMSRRPNNSTHTSRTRGAIQPRRCGRVRELLPSTWPM